MWQLWKDANAKDFLLKAIDWYVEVNQLSLHSDGPIIMSQTALELIYNWLIVEKNKLLIGKDAANIAAANKMRLLLSNIKVDKAIPPNFDNLKKIKEFVDGPDAITQIRNAIVHSQEEKRRKLNSFSNMTKFEAIYLSIWYIEMALLYILEFDAVYLNRCTNYKTRPHREYVPWAKQIDKE